MIRFSLSFSHLATGLGKYYINAKVFIAQYDPIFRNQTAVVGKKYCSSFRENGNKILGGNVKKTFADRSNLTRCHRPAINGVIP
jgi:hypothetical protein